MRFLPAALLNRLRRDKVQDPFGGDEDDFGGEPGFSLSGPKLALAASGLLFVLLIGGVATVVLTGEAPNTPPPVMGSFADLEIVEEAEPPASPEAAPSLEAIPSNAIAATDRSAERRPWLTPTEPTADASARPGVSDNASNPAPAVKPAPPKAPTVETAAIPEPETVPEVSPEAPMAAIAPETAAPTEAANAPAAEMETAIEEDIEPVQERSLADAGPAPGAPGLMSVAEDSPADLAGGRPRLTEPTLPPTDRQAVGAPPPRYANLANVRNDADRTPPAANASKIAVVVGGLGLNATATEAAILKLPATVTLAFSPYARDLKKWVEMAKEHGHEVLIEIPMESKQFPAKDPGPLGLLTSLEEKEQTERLEAILKDGEGAVGVLDSMGSRYRESDQHINAVFKKLSEKNLYYVQGEPGVRVGEATIPTAITDVVIDERPFRAAIDARLDYAERLAKYQGSAVVSLSAKPVGFERVVLWMEQIASKNIVLAPMSQVLIR